MTDSPSAVALIPARSGSKRVPGKNIKLLNGHPMIAYTIVAAIGSNVFEKVIVSTDSDDYASIARHYGAEVPFLRPQEISGATSPDIEWVEHALNMLKDKGNTFDCFSILRPTSPFRKPETIQRAWHEFLDEAGIDSLRAVEKCKQHPGKMWVAEDQRMKPLLSGGPKNPPWHSSQYTALPVVYVQNASLEIAWTCVVFQGRTIAGDMLMPFFTQGLEGFDINDNDDWWRAEHLLKNQEATLVPINMSSYTFEEQS